jgi:hypothetical protein
MFISSLFFNYELIFLLVKDVQSPLWVTRRRLANIKIAQILQKLMVQNSSQKRLLQNSLL